MIYTYQDRETKKKYTLIYEEIIDHLEKTFQPEYFGDNVLYTQSSACGKLFFEYIDEPLLKEIIYRWKQNNFTIHSITDITIRDKQYRILTLDAPDAYKKTYMLPWPISPLSMLQHDTFSVQSFIILKSEYETTISKYITEKT